MACVDCARACSEKPFRASLNLLFGDVLVAVVIVVCLSSLVFHATNVRRVCRELVPSIPGDHRAPYEFPQEITLRPARKSKF